MAHNTHEVDRSGPGSIGETFRVLFFSAWMEGNHVRGGVAIDEKANNLYWRGCTIYEKADNMLTDAFDALYVTAFWEGFRFQGKSHNGVGGSIVDIHEKAWRMTTIYKEAVNMMRKQFSTTKKQVKYVEQCQRQKKNEEHKDQKRRVKLQIELPKQIQQCEQQLISAFMRGENYEAEQCIDTLKRLKDQLSGNAPGFIVNEEGLPSYIHTYNNPQSLNGS